MSSEVLKNGLTYALIGAGVGGLIGLGKTLKDTMSVQSSSNSSPKENKDSDLLQYKFLKLDSIVVEALDRFKTYKNLCPHEYKTILDNLDRLIGIQVDINNGKIEPTFSYKATSCVTTIKLALSKCKTRVRNVSVQHWDTDEEMIRQISEDYIYNITQDVNQHTLNGRTV